VKTISIYEKTEAEIIDLATNYYLENLDKEKDKYEIFNSFNSSLSTPLKEKEALFIISIFDAIEKDPDSFLEIQNLEINENSKSN
jgi:hypothetical protein